MSEREWRFYLNDMIGFAEKVLVYTEGSSEKGSERRSGKAKSDEKAQFTRCK